MNPLQWCRQGPALETGRRTSQRLTLLKHCSTFTVSVTVINKMKNVIRDITKLLVTYFVPVIIITMFICFCMDMPGTTAAIVGSLMGYFFICFDGGKARKAIRRATSTFSKVYSFFDSDRTNVYHEDLTPLHHVTVSTPALFHIGKYILCILVCWILFINASSKQTISKR